MLKSALLASVAVVAIFAASASASDKLEVAPAAAWVKPVVLADAPSKDAASAPFAVLNRSMQVNFTGNGDSYFTELAIKIQTPQGLPAGQPYLTWNPATDTAVVHWVHIIRDGKVIDVLANQSFTVVRRENNLENAMLDGVLTAVLQPEGLQVGDTLDYALTITQRDPVLNGRSEAFMYVPDGSAVAKAGYRVLWTADKPLRWQKSDDLAAPKVVKSKTGNELTLDLVDYKRPDGPDQAPARFNNFGELQFTQFASWNDLSALMAPLYAKASTLSETSPLRAEVAKIKAQSSDPEVQAAAALHLVEDQVRYVFIAANEGGYVPADADTTWTRRFGDCKAKSALLMALLHELGIGAEAAIVNTASGDGMDGRLPMAELFDHVIVRTAIGGKTYWLDGTRYGDRTLDSLQVPGYRWALPLRAGGAALEAMVVPPLDKPNFESSMKIDASAGIDAPAPAHAETLFRGDGALQVKSMIDQQSPADLEKNLRDYWKGRNDWIDIDKVSAKYDPATGEAVVTMDGKAKMEWSEPEYTHGRRYLADGYGLGGDLGLKREPGLHTDAPVAVDYPSWDRATETVILPNKGKDFAVTGEMVDKTLGGVAMKRSMAIKDGVFTIEASSRSLQPEIPLAEAKAAAEPLKTLGKSAVYINAPYTYSATADDKKAATAAAGPAPKTSADFLERGRQYVMKSQYEKARDDFDAAAKLDPASSTPITARGSAKAILKDMAGARADFDAAIKLNPRDARAFSGRAGIRAGDKDYAGAIEDYTRALDLSPSDITLRLQRAGTFAMSGDKARALDDALTAQSMQPDNPMAVAALAEAYLENDKYAEAETTLRDASGKSPQNTALHIQLAETLMRCASKTQAQCIAARAEAVTEYDKAIAIEPTAYAYTSRSQARPFGEKDAKLADVNLALAMEPDSTFALTARGSIYMSLKDYDKSLADLNAVLAKDPHDEQALNVRSLIYEKQRNYDAQIADLKVLAADDPTNAAWLNSLCWARAINGRDLDKAMEECNAAVKLKPDQMAFIDSRGMVNLRMGKLDAAIADYDSAIKLRPDSSSSLYGRGIAKKRKGMTKEANKDLAAARKIYPGVDAQFAPYGITP